MLFDQSTYDKLIAEVPKYKMITPSILSDRLRLNGSLARAGKEWLLYPAEQFLFLHCALCGRYLFGSATWQILATAVASTLWVVVVGTCWQLGSVSSCMSHLPCLSGVVAAIRELLSKGLIKPIAEHSSQKIYTRAVGQ